jgi:hypothetical protein
MLFYKACFEEDLCQNYIPGTVTTSLSEALKWYRIYFSKKRKRFGINRKGKVVIISMSVDTEHFLPAEEFQKKGVKEHSRQNCWTSSLQTKAQINTPTKVQLIPENTILNM